jgi:ankyrin repeat protein
MRQVDQDLLNASTEGDLEKAQRAIEKGANIARCQSIGYTPLYVASQYGQDAIVSLLLEKGANVNVQDKGGTTPLHYACRKGHDAIISLLLEKGADIDAKDNIGYTPLHYACHILKKEFISKEQTRPIVIVNI